MRSIVVSQRFAYCLEFLVRELLSLLELPLCRSQHRLGCLGFLGLFDCFQLRFLAPAIRSLLAFLQLLLEALEKPTLGKPVYK